MDLLIILTYAAFAYGCFKVFKIPVNKWTVPTAVLGGVFVVAGLVLTMNYNHPYTYVAQKAVVAVPIISQVVGVVDEVPVRRNEHLKAGDELFRIDPTVYQARVDRLKADLVTAEQSVAAQRDQLSVTQAQVAQVRADRDKARKDLTRYEQAARKAVNPFTEQEATNARQAFLAQEARLSAAEAQQQQIQSQLDAIVNGENAGIVSLRAQLKEAEYNLAQTVVRAPSDGYVTQVLLDKGSYVNSMPFRPAMFFIPDQGRRVVASFRQNSLLRVKAGDEAEVVFTGVPGTVFKGKVRQVMPVVPEGVYHTQFALQTISFDGRNGILAEIELDPAVDAYHLPDGVAAQVAIYTEHFHHVAVMRKVLLRMTGWMHYLYLDH
ncbi:HlyD family secretion protein [Pseudaeromonas paramecii]|uniref:HlyD family secretion protein n=1 Tax=Pseudaeromonas paramecii TaxID=2138166 RepID=A0ABP8QAB9_9GAMM